MHTYRIGEAAALPGVSTDTVRRLVDGGKLAAERDESGRRIITGPDLAAHARQVHRAERDSTSSSARNRLSGIVTDVTSVMCRHRWRSRPVRSGWWRWSAANRLKNWSVIKSTNVVVERP